MPTLNTKTAVASLAMLAGGLAAAPASAVVVMISDLTSGSANKTIDAFFTENFTNVTEIRHGNFANYTSTASQDALNGTGTYAGQGAADVFVIGRSLSSADYDAGDADGYNGIAIPFINFTSYTARPDANRLGWHAGTSGGAQSRAGDETEVTADGAAFFGVAAGDYDFWNDGDGTFNGSGTGSVGGGTVLANVGSQILAAHWDTGDAPGSVANAGVSTFAGDRLLLNLDNDPGTSPAGGNDFAGLTAAGLEAYVNAIEFATPLKSGGIAGADFSDAATFNAAGGSLSATTDDLNTADNITVSGWSAIGGDGFVGGLVTPTLDTNAQNGMVNDNVIKIDGNGQTIPTANVDDETGLAGVSFDLVIPDTDILDLDEVRFAFRMATGDPNTRWLAFRTSLDDEIIWSEVGELRNDFDLQTIDLSAAKYQGLTDETVSFFFYAGGTGSGDIDIDTIVVDGSVTIIPEPTSLALLGLGGLLIARRRRG